MPEYLVEAYLDGIHLGDLPHITRRARESADHFTDAAATVRYEGSIAIPNDEMCFHLYAGPSAASVTEATTRAAISVERIVRSDPCRLGTRRLAGRRRGGEHTRSATSGPDPKR